MKKSTYRPTGKCPCGQPATSSIVTRTERFLFCNFCAKAWYVARYPK